MLLHTHNTVDATQRSEAPFPGTGHTLNRATVIDMLPLTHKDKRSLSYRIKSKLYDWKRLIFSDKNSRNLFLFLLLNLSFAFVELFYGIATNSLGECVCAEIMCLPSFCIYLYSSATTSTLCLVSAISGQGLASRVRCIILLSFGAFYEL